MTDHGVRINHPSFSGYRFPNKTERFDHDASNPMIKYEMLQQRPPMAYETYPPHDYTSAPAYADYPSADDPRFYQHGGYPYASAGGYGYGAPDALAPMPLPPYEAQQRYKHLDPDFLDEAIQCIPQLESLEMTQYRGTSGTYGRPPTTYSPSSNAPSSTGSATPQFRPPAPRKAASDKPNPRLCRVPGCNKGIRSRGLCKGHGGGRRCQTAGCKISDQGGGHCIAHGGGRRCSEPGCTRSAQARGRCKCHGGGRPCKMEGCGKNSQRSGYCMTHAKFVEQQRAHDDVTNMSV
ncbi:hypothetical protein ACHHYP_13694 [Achlya hypogyna]|uniref:WRKY19-like zinc finger domain-containing protein n=1 Tax=Achlya hypogyna TaxID=1202772 RepID=A0A1V9YES5_ACHHY|nr:hypothetical protein ACHHYP_13694 [Achlya hypogyna]